MKYLILVSLVLAAGVQQAQAFELSRKSVKIEPNGVTSTIICTLTENELRQRTIVDDADVVVISKAQTNADKIEVLIKQVTGIPLPDTTNAVEYGVWTAKLDAYSPEIVVRTNFTYKNGQNYVNQDKHIAGTELPLLNGRVCGF